MLSPAVAQQRSRRPRPGVGADANVLTPPQTATRVRASAAIPAAPARSLRTVWLVARRLLVWPAARYSPDWGGGSQSPRGPGVRRLASALRGCPAVEVSLSFPPARSTKGVRTPPRAVSPTARPRRVGVGPPFPSRIPLPVGPSRQLLPCGVWRAGPCRRALLLLGYGVGLGKRLAAALLLCFIRKVTR